AEKMLINLVTRAKDLKQSGINLNASEELIALLQHNFTLEDFRNNRNIFEDYAQLDDNDIWGAIKLWKKHDGYILANISNMLLERKLFKIDLTNKPLSKEALHKMEDKVLAKLKIPEQDLSYFFSCGTISNNAYVADDRISILTKKGKLIDLAQAADLPNIKAMSKIVKKHYACHAKELTLRPTLT